MTTLNDDGFDFQLPPNLDLSLNGLNSDKGSHESFADKSLVGYQQFMKLVLQHKDWRVEKIAPSPMIQFVWDQHVSTDTNHYIKSCKDYTGGHVVSHRSEANALEDFDSRQDSIRITKISLTALFGQKGVDQEVWAFPETNHHEEGRLTPAEQGFCLPITLRECCMKMNKWDKTFADKALRAYKIFMGLKVQQQDWDTNTLVPPNTVICVWLEHSISHEDHYIRACKDFAHGHVIARIPIAYDHPELEQRIQKTVGLLHKFHGHELDQEIWSYEEYFDGKEEMVGRKRRRREGQHAMCVEHGSGADKTREEQRNSGTDHVKEFAMSNLNRRLFSD